MRSTATLRRSDVDAHRMVENVAGQLGDRRRHGGREQQRLAIAPALRNDLPHVMDEAHVEHAVGLVEHEDGNLVEPDVALVAEVEQASGRGDQDIDAGFQRLYLVMLVDAAEDDGGAQGQPASISGEPLGDLAGQLAGRRQDQRVRRAGRARQPLERKPLQNRQREGCRLAGSRLGDAEQVLALGEQRNGLRLDRRRFQVVFSLQREPQGLDQAEAVESGVGHSEKSLCAGNGLKAQDMRVARP